MLQLSSYFYIQKPIPKFQRNPWSGPLNLSYTVSVTNILWKLKICFVKLKAPKRPAIARLLHSRQWNQERRSSAILFLSPPIAQAVEGGELMRIVLRTMSRRISLGYFPSGCAAGRRIQHGEEHNEPRYTRTCMCIYMYTVHARIVADFRGFGGWQTRRAAPHALVSLVLYISFIRPMPNCYRRRWHCAPNQSNLCCGFFF